jgi:hypothetical protein
MIIEQAAHKYAAPAAPFPTDQNTLLAHPPAIPEASA